MNEINIKYSYILQESATQYGVDHYYVILSHLSTYFNNSIIVDLGWAANISSNIRLGIKAENLINPFLNWDIDTGGGLSTSYQETYPLIISIGSIYKMSNIHKIMLQEDVSFFDKDTESINFDNNYSYLTRIGYEYSPSNNFDFRLGLEGKNNIKFGFGYHVTLYNKLPFQFIIEAEGVLSSLNSLQNFLFKFLKLGQ